MVDNAILAKIETMAVTAAALMPMATIGAITFVIKIMGAMVIVAMVAHVNVTETDSRPITEKEDKILI
jgi:uncharacterized membrane protein YecN with MAPEG domain